MYELTKEQQQKLTTVLKDYLNANDWKGIFAETNCEEFAQQNSKFYENVSWENENLEKDCNEALAFVLNKDSSNLRAIWEVPGVETMTRRQDESLYAEIAAIIEQGDTQSSAPITDNYPDLTGENKNPYQTLDEAENFLHSDRTSDTIVLINKALRNYLQQTCENKRIAISSEDSISLLQAKVIDYIKRQNTGSQNQLLRTTTIITETIDDLTHQNQNSNALTKADLNYAINQSRIFMVYLDEILG